MGGPCQMITFDDKGGRGGGHKIPQTRLRNTWMFPYLVQADKNLVVSTLPVKMFGPFWSVWCKMALAEVGVSLP